MASSTTGKALKRRVPPPIPRRAQKPDWTWIRREWESDLKSDRQIAAQSTAAGRKVSHVAIGKRAHKEGWKKRPLGPEVRSEVERRLAQAAVSTVSEGHASHEEVVDAAARQGVEVVRQHRKVLDRGRSLTETMLSQLEDATHQAADLEALIAEEERAAPNAPKAEIDARAQRRARLMRSIGLGTRASVLKDLANAARNWISLERVAFNLNDKETATPDSIEARLAMLEREEA